MLRYLFSSAVLALAISAGVASAQQNMDNDAVLKLQKAGLSETIIVDTINSSPGHYDTSANALIALKQDGITDKEVAAMLTRNASPGGPATAGAPAVAASLPPGVDEIGVYYKAVSGKWVELPTEIVNYKSGGVLKTLATDGIVKGDRNGHLDGKSSPLAVTRPIEVLIYAPDGTAPNEYQLLDLRGHAKSREFRSATGGVFHASTGADRDRHDFNATKIGPRLYTFTVGMDLQPGEYGILPPGSYTSTNAASAGKIDTFHITE